MKLKYIGNDTFYGLVYGQVYTIDLFVKNSFIWVRVDNSKVAIPYLSPLAFSNNWTVTY